MLEEIYRYIHHRLNAKGIKGFGIHSPFVFNLVTKTINNKTRYNCYKPIEKQRKALLKNNKIVTVLDLGAGSANLKEPAKRIADIAKNSLKPKKQARLLFRLVNYHQPNTILELGTSLGITASYLASVNPKSKIITIEGCPDLTKIAEQTFSNLNIDNVELVNGPINEMLPKVLEQIQQLDFVFFDANHRKEPTLDYFNRCLPYIQNESLFIFDDIHKSDEMDEAWETIKQHPKVTATIDLYYMGLVYFKHELTKQDFKVKI